MSGYLFCIAPYHGHANPILHIVRELTRRGERVAVYTGGAFRQAVEAAGAQFRPIPESDSPGDMLERELGIVQAILEPARADQPACVVYDAMTMWGKLLAGVIGAPAARVHVQFPVTEQYHPFDTFAPMVPVKEHFEEFDRDFKGICDRLGLPAMTYHELLYHAEPLNIVPFPEPFVAGREHLDERFHFVGPLFDAPEAPSSSEKVVYVSLGTINTNMAAFYDLCIGALGDTDREVVISTGDQVDYSAFGPIPANVSLHRRVPQLEVLQRTAVFVNHAGLNSVMEAFWYGIPMVVLPLTPEQAAVAARMVQLRLGAVLDLRMATRHVLRELIAHVEGDPEIRAEVEAMRKAIHACGGSRQAADLLVDYVRGRSG
jgi:MGT family glycosyltransferase